MASNSRSGIGHVMQLEALAENHPQHAQHVQHYMAYADAVGKDTYDDVMKYIDTHLPQMIDKAIQDYMNQQKIQVQLEESSVQQVKTKITNLIKSLFN